MSNFHTTLFQNTFVLVFWPDCHNIGTHLKLNKYIFDILIPFCHHLYLSATLKQCFTEFAVCRTTFHHVDMSVRGRIPTCDLIGWLFLGSGMQRECWFSNLTLKITDYQVILSVSINWLWYWKTASRLTSPKKT